MTETKAGGIKSCNTIMEKYGTNFYQKTGKMGGSVFRKAPRWFALHPDLAKAAGAKGGRASTRKGVKNGEGKKWKKLESKIGEEYEKIYR